MDTIASITAKAQLAAGGVTGSALALADKLVTDGSAKWTADPEVTNVYTLVTRSGETMITTYADGEFDISGEFFALLP